MQSKVLGINTVSKNLKYKFELVKSKLLEIVSVNSRNLQTTLRVEHLQGGTSDSRLKKRSGRAQVSIRVIRTVFTGDEVSGGVTLGAKYLKTHIITADNPNKSTTIRAKPGKALAIPLKAAMTSAGVPKGKPRDKNVFGNMNMFIKRTAKGGKLILFGQLKYQKGKKTGQMQNKLVPLFLLVKKVTVKKRINLVTLLKKTEQEMIKDIKAEVVT